MSPIISGGITADALPALARNVGQVQLDFAQDVSGGLHKLSLSYSLGDASMVNLTDPTAPLTVSPGLYAFTLSCTPAPSTLNTWGAGILADDNFYTVRARTFTKQDETSACVVWWCDANDPFAVEALNYEDVTPGAVHFVGSLFVQRVR